MFGRRAINYSPATIGQQVPGVFDVITQPLYDTVVAVTGSVTLTFFQNPVGAGVGAFGGAGVAKTKADTNLRLSGQLPAGYEFTVLGFRLATVWDVTFADFTAFLNRAVFRFEVGSKDYLEVPAVTIPAGNGPFGFYTQAMAAAATLVNNGWPAATNMFGIRSKPLILTGSSNFNGSLNWPATTPTIATTGYQPSPGLPIRLYIDGTLKRPAQ